MLFSIIIPTYNRANELVKLIDSILLQKYPEYEIIIVDDGSTDNTEELISKKFGYSHLIKYIKQENKERGVARNTGTKNANGAYINFFDSDDIMYPNHLSEAFNLIQNNDKPEVFAFAFECKLPNGDLLYTKYYPKNLNTILIEGNQLSCNSVFLRKDIALKHLFNEDRELSVFEDWELWVRVASRYPIHISSVVTSVIINHDGRSVLSVNRDKLVKRGKLLLTYLKSDDEVLKAYAKSIHKLKSSINSYISLHLAMSKNYRLESLAFFFNAFIANPKFILKRRFWAIIKTLIL